MMIFQCFFFLNLTIIIIFINDQFTLGCSLAVNGMNVLWLAARNMASILQIFEYLFLGMGAYCHSVYGSNTSHFLKPSKCLQKFKNGGKSEKLT